MKRSEILDKYKWDPTAVYPSREAFEAALKEAAEAIAAYARFDGTLEESGENLLTALEEETRLYRQLDRLGQYVTRESDVDKGNNEAQALQGRVWKVIVAGL